MFVEQPLTSPGCAKQLLDQLFYQHAFNYKIICVQLRIEIDKTQDPGHARNIPQIACSRLKVWYKYIVHVQNIGLDRLQIAGCQVEGFPYWEEGGWFKTGQTSNFFSGRWIPFALRVPIQDTKTKKHKRKKNAF